MRLKNTTRFPTPFLRRMVSWCRSQIDLPAKRVREIMFANGKGWRGRAWWSGRVLVRVARETTYPKTWQYRKSAPPLTFTDDLEVLVSLTAHELWHQVQYMHGRKTDESQNERIALSVLSAFRVERESLLAEWSKIETKPEKPKVSVVEKRATKVQADLARWQRKLKLAQTKVKKLKAKARYYDGKVAACE